MNRATGSGSIGQEGNWIALHIKLAIVLTYDLEAKPLVEPRGGVDSNNVQSHRLIDTCSFANQALHHLGTNTSALKPVVHKHLCEKKRNGLQPTYVGTVER